MLTNYASYLRKSDQEWSRSLPKPRKSYRRFHLNPDAFNSQILKRKAYWDRQREICRAIADPSIRTVLAITGNGVGKSYLGAGIALWYGQSHEPAKVLTTGPTFDQLRAVLWGNIFRAYHQSELEGTAVSLRHDSLLIQWADEWFIKGINPDNIESASGYHGGNLIALVDEASALTAAKNEAIDSWDVAKKILFGNPLRPDGPFYELYQRHIHDPDPATCVIKIPSTESPAIKAGLRRSPDGFVGLDWLDDRRREYGEDSPWWKSHVLAEFPDTAEGQLVARDWIDRSVSTTVDSSDDRTEPILAIDLGAGRGGDRSVLLVRTGRRLIHLESSNRWDLEETARRAVEICQRFSVKPSRVIYDRSGLGEGFGAILRTAGLVGAIGFLGGSEARGHQKRFENLKSASAWQLRTRMNPEQSHEPFAIPHEWAAQLRPELQAYTYEVTSRDKIKLTDKETINARLGRSPDLADALIMSFVAIDRGGGGLMLGILGNLAAFASSSTPANFAAIDKEIRAGLHNERKRMDIARTARDYYEGRFEAYMSDYGRILAIRDNAPNRRSIPYVRAIIDAKIRRMYMSDPKRTITDNPQATEYLNSLYSKGRATPKIKDSLVYAALGGACAIQVEINQPKSDGETQATLAGARPAVGFRLWAADEFAVWCSPDEPLTPYAVAVLDRYDAKTRCRLWTPDVFAVYESEKWDGSGNTAGTRVFKEVSTEANFLGIVPFAFTWWREPTKDFWTWCPGPELVDVNDQANARLSKIADDTIFTRPMTFSRNVNETWTPPDRTHAGQILKLPGIVETIGDSNDGPSLETTMVDLSYLAADREELEAHLELQGEMHGVPKEQWRLRGGNSPSGVAIVSEQLPIIEECEARQILMESTEKDLALVTLMTVSAWLRDMPGAAGIIGPINQAIDNFDMSIQWPPLTKNRPGPDFDQHQQFELINGMMSPIQALMESKGMTEQEAIEHMAQKAEHDALIASMAPPMPDATSDPNADQQPQEQQQEPQN